MKVEAIVGAVVSSGAATRGGYDRMRRMARRRTGHGALGGERVRLWGARGHDEEDDEMEMELQLNLRLWLSRRRIRPLLGIKQKGEQGRDFTSSSSTFHHLFIALMT